MNKIIEKPTPITKSAIDYHSAAMWIEQKLGYDLSDTLGMFKEGHNPDVEYRDYWHFLVDNCDIQNDSKFWLTSDLLENCEPWQAEITQAFIDEFGDECEFWTNW